MQRNQTTPYQIDTAKIFFGGGSAGSVTAMMSSCYTQTMIDAVFPGVSASLGGIDDQDFYYGINDTRVDPKGILDMWGGMPVPTNVTSATFFKGHALPIICFHGGADGTFNYIQQPVFFAPATFPYTQWNKEGHCLPFVSPFSLNPVGGMNPDAFILGAVNIYNTFYGLNKFTELYIDCDMGHGLDNANNGTSAYTSNFGTSSITVNATCLYIAQRAATFFQGVMNNFNSSTLPTTRFKDCENYRSTCNTADNNNNCPDDTNMFTQCPPSDQ